MVVHKAGLKFILIATRKTDRMRLHLLNRNTEHSGFVVCWNYDTDSGTWDWGTYCDTLKDALTAFVEKCEEHDFNEVFEGYFEK